VKRNPTRPVPVGTVTLGGGHAVAVQSMCATRTRDVDATVAQAEAIRAAGGDLVRVAVDNPQDVEALAEIRRQTSANLVVDLQENYRLAEQVAPHVDKLRYNPGHLYHHEKSKPVAEKVRFLAEVARAHDCALRVGVNCGSVDPETAERFPEDEVAAMVQSALEHCRYLDDLGFERYVVSLKDSHPRKVIEANTRFAGRRADVPLHLGVTEAGIPPEGIIKTRTRKSRWAGRSWAISPPGASAPCRCSTTTSSTSSRARPARAWRTSGSWSWRRRSSGSRPTPSATP
jgi:(E)-4-hydroxy-3-methylbut-2-enyl-diphosphate synthase